MQLQLVVNLVQLVSFLPLLLLIRPSVGDQHYDSTATDGRFDALSPDDTLFAHLRCFELYTSNHSLERERDASSWLSYDERYLTGSERTPSFLRCVLVRLQFYDAECTLFNTTLIEKQFNKYRAWMSLSEESVEAFINDTSAIDVLNDSLDTTVYNAFEPLFKRHFNAYFQLFLRDASVLENIYHQKTFPVRNPNQTVTQFCELQMDAALWNDICLIRSYEISNRTVAMQKHVDCIFRGFRYLDEDNSIDESEIIRDYHLVGIFNETLEEEIQECTKNASTAANSQERSLVMYSCLLAGNGSDTFKAAFDFREIRSGNISYTLHNLPYDRVQVKQQIRTLDRERCDDRQRPAVRFMEV